MIMNDYIDKTFVLFGNCIPVLGASRSTVCDLQNGKFHFIPNALYTILTDHKNNTLAQLISIFGESKRAVLHEYFSNLLENKLGFFSNSNSIEKFPQLSMQWDFPSLISNSIVDIDFTLLDISLVKKFIVGIDNLNCHCLQLRFFNDFDEQKLEILIRDTNIYEFRLVIPSVEEDLIDRLIENNTRISNIHVYNCDHFGFRNYKDVNIIYTTGALSSNDCGNVCMQSFVPNVPHFTEAKNFNSCLNRKVSLDVNGLVKNCPSSKISYGHISEVSSLEEVIDSNFKKFWHIKKDDISVCKDCEFRFICTDCRVFVENDDEIGKPSKCNYDPYIAKWI